ncbi:MAG TPA: M13 family metallopeptidase [Candidatus Eisenbacteria bacterium]
MVPPRPGRLPAALALAFALAFHAAAAHAATSPAAPAGARPIDPANIDTSVRPGDDFFRYANGKWLETHPIPPDESRWGAFSELIEHNQEVLHDILEAAAKRGGAAPGSAPQLAGDFYASAMDSAAIEAAGTRPLEEELGRIRSVHDVPSLEDEIARLEARGLRAPFALFAAQDAKRSTEVIVQVAQSGLGMPDRDYYTKKDDASQKLRDQYLAHVTRMFALLGDEAGAAAANARTVLDLETRLAEASMTRVERRDPDATYHRVSFDSLAILAPGIDWPRIFTQLGITGRPRVNVAQPAFMAQVGVMLTSVPVADWRTYLRWHLANATAEYLGTAFVDENFDFNGRILTGTTVLRPRWKRMVQVVDQNVGEALGQLYVERAFSPSARDRARRMVAELRAELRARIQQLEWMSPETKQQALRKLDAFAVKIGYPDTWRNYTGLTIDRGPLVLNVMRARAFEFERVINKLGKPVDRKEWGMTPPTVNAYYNARMNEIVFPAGILQPPFFDANADDAVNYGGIGAVIGHEMTHGFDDQGRKSDAEGNLADWWTPADQKQYDARTGLVEKQFDGYVAVDSVHVNGKLTLGENLADLGGLSIAYGAFEKTLKGKSRKPIDGFTPEQRFFLSYAQIWRQNSRPEALKLRINTDPHSPGMFRCNGPLSNMPEFAQAFDLKDGEPMVRPAAVRAKIW